MRTLTTLAAVTIAVLAVAALQVIQPQPVHADAGLGERYDTNDSGFIDRDEVLAAIFDYIGGELSKDEVLRLIGLYFSDVPVRAADEPSPEVEPVAPDSYVAVVPRALRSGFEERVSISLLSGDQPASGDVRLTLRDDEVTLLSLLGRVEGTGGLKILVPQIESGTYEIEIRVDGIQETRRAPVEIVDGVALFVETDKPIYKPGQTVHVRLMTLDALLKPRPYAATIEVQDAKGLKVFRKEVETDEFGMVTVDLPLSTEPNLGVWKLTAIAGDQKTELDVRVEEYVLPKYEVTVATERDWVLAGDPITGTVSGEYSFGKPVEGDVEIIASRYVGQWEEFARFSGPIDGETPFELPAVGFVAGVPQAGGQGNVTLDVTIREKGTGYVERTSKLLTVVASPVTLKVIPESRVFKPGLEMGYLVVAQTPDGTPVDTDVTLTIDYVNEHFWGTEASSSHTVTTSGGRALVKTAPPEGAVALTLWAEADGSYTSLSLQSGHSPSGNFIHLEQLTTGDIRAGDIVRFRVNSTKEASNFYYEVLSRGTTLFTGVSSGPIIEFAATHLMAPSSRLLVYQILPNNEIAADYLPFSVRAAYPHKVSAGFGREEVRPGDPVDIDVQTQGESRVGLVAVDRSVFILAENRLNLQQVFNELERLYLEPQAELHDARYLETIETRGAQETFEAAGTIVLTNKEVPTGETFRPAAHSSGSNDGRRRGPGSRAGGGGGT